MQRIIALDIGTVRIGVAVSDPLGFFAQGIAVLRAEGEWLEELAEITAVYENPKLLVGLPRRTDGSEGPEAIKMRDTAETIRDRFPDLEIEFWDERFTTAIAQQALIEADVSRRGRKQKVDKIAAALLLQSYLDRGRT
ncbi:MAG: Holliday junction resolvase RuvX [Synergistaceae bacterium]|nr:Holliday junction resolvase RuvX [Synergistaceae bacterium]